MSNIATTRKNGSKANTNSNSLTFPTWSSWIDEVFNRDLPSVFNSNFNAGLTLPKVNIRETKDAYFVDMAVPGLKKSDFQIELDNKKKMNSKRKILHVGNLAIHPLKGHFHYLKQLKRMLLKQNTKMVY